MSTASVYSPPFAAVMNSLADGHTLLNPNKPPISLAQAGFGLREMAHGARSTPTWPSRQLLGELALCGAASSHFVLYPGDYVHINKGEACSLAASLPVLFTAACHYTLLAGRLHAFRKLHGNHPAALAFALRPVDCIWRTQAEADLVVSAGGNAHYNSAAPFCGLPSLAKRWFSGPRPEQERETPVSGIREIRQWRGPSILSPQGPVLNTWQARLASCTTGVAALAPNAADAALIHRAPPDVVDQVDWELRKSQVWLPRSPMAPHQDMCTSIAWDWLYMGCTPSGCLEEAQTAITAAAYNSLYKRNSISVSSAAVRGMALAALAAAPWNMRQRYRQALQQVVNTVGHLPASAAASGVVRAYIPALASAAEQQSLRDQSSQSIFGTTKFQQHFEAVLQAATATLQATCIAPPAQSSLDAVGIEVRASELLCGGEHLSSSGDTPRGTVRLLLATMPTYMPGFQMGQGVRWWEWAASVSVVLRDMVDYLERAPERAAAQTQLDRAAGEVHTQNLKNQLTKEDKFANCLLVARKRQLATRRDLQERLQARTAQLLDEEPAQRGDSMQTAADTTQAATLMHLCPPALPALRAPVMLQPVQVESLIPHSSPETFRGANHLDASEPQSSTSSAALQLQSSFDRQTLSSQNCSLFSTEPGSISPGGASAAQSDHIAWAPGRAPQPERAPYPPTLLQQKPFNCRVASHSAPSAVALPPPGAAAAMPQDGAPEVQDGAPVPPSPNGSLSGKLRYEVELAKWEAQLSSPAPRPRRRRRVRDGASAAVYTSDTGSSTAGTALQLQQAHGSQAACPLDSTPMTRVRSRNRALTPPVPSAGDMQELSTAEARDALLDLTQTARGKRARSVATPVADTEHGDGHGLGASGTAAVGAKKRPRRRAAQDAANSFKRVMGMGTPDERCTAAATPQAIDPSAVVADTARQDGTANAPPKKRGRRPGKRATGAAESAPRAASQPKELPAAESTPRRPRKIISKRPLASFQFPQNWDDDEFAAGLRSLARGAGVPVELLSSAHWPPCQSPRVANIAAPMATADPTSQASIDAAAIQADQVHAQAPLSSAAHTNLIPLAIMDLERNRQAMESLSEAYGYEPSAEFKRPFVKFEPQPDLSGSVHLHLKAVVAGTGPESSRRQAALLLQAAQAEAVADTHIGEDIDAVGVDGYYCVLCRGEIVGGYVACVGCFAKQGIQHNMCLHCYTTNQPLHIDAGVVSKQMLGRQPQSCPVCATSVVPLPGKASFRPSAMPSAPPLSSEQSDPGPAGNGEVQPQPTTEQPKQAPVVSTKPKPKAANVASGSSCPICFCSEQQGCVCHSIPALHFRFETPVQHRVILDKLLMAARWQRVPTGSHSTYVPGARTGMHSFQSAQDGHILDTAARLSLTDGQLCPGPLCDSPEKLHWLSWVSRPSQAAVLHSMRSLESLGSDPPQTQYRGFKQGRLNKSCSLWGNTWSVLHSLDAVFGRRAAAAVGRVAEIAQSRSKPVISSMLLAQDASLLRLASGGARQYLGPTVGRPPHLHTSGTSTYGELPILSMQPTVHARIDCEGVASPCEGLSLCAVEGVCIAPSEEPAASLCAVEGVCIAPSEEPAASLCAVEGVCIAPSEGPAASLAAQPPTHSSVGLQTPTSNSDPSPREADELDISQCAVETDCTTLGTARTECAVGAARLVSYSSASPEQGYELPLPQRTRRLRYASSTSPSSVDISAGEMGVVSSSSSNSSVAAEGAGHSPDSSVAAGRAGHSANSSVAAGRAGHSANSSVAAGRAGRTRRRATAGRHTQGSSPPFHHLDCTQAVVAVFPPRRTQRSRSPASVSHPPPMSPGSSAAHPSAQDVSVSPAMGCVMGFSSLELSHDAASMTAGVAAGVLSSSLTPSPASGDRDLADEPAEPAVGATRGKGRYRS